MTTTDTRPAADRPARRPEDRPERGPERHGPAGDTAPGPPDGTEPGTARGTAAGPPRGPRHERPAPGRPHEPAHEAAYPPPRDDPAHEPADGPAQDPPPRPAPDAAESDSAHRPADNGPARPAARPRRRPRGSTAPPNRRDTRRPARLPARHPSGELRPHEWFAERLVLALSGQRPMHWLLGHTAGPAYDQLVAFADELPLRGGPRPELRACGYCRPAPDVIEAFARVALGDRLRALAFRLELGPDHRWRCAAVEVGPARPHGRA
ncbi:Rv3235 family protein [Streptomyces sp. WMMC500]|uniref:Rv3235 family protein n=1 Tax=Streptomyces sp. WMMC500 TaxID=3015154 RepID=UPI00248ADB2E|nr:Rv3235 family protein [Streptomyces sp. WMMC500]WBB59000.1 Rv3235 family protein [Streptomyces sp. WMMC500]